MARRCNRCRAKILPPVPAAALPRSTQKELSAMIDKGLTNRQIFERLHKDRGTDMVRSHLLP
jgi:hypothetical protein